MSHTPSPPSPYQHWLDDAANMGLMLFRMRNDSKREAIVQQHQQHGPPPPPPPPSPPRSSAPIPIPLRSSVGVGELRLPHPHPSTTTPRTQALQTPTVATSSRTQQSQDPLD